MAQVVEDMDEIKTPATTTATEEKFFTTTETYGSLRAEDVPLHKDVAFIIAMICFGIGAILLVVGFIRLLAWWIDTKKQEREQERWFRHLQHIRHLEDYSIRTGDATSVFGDNLSLYLSESKSMNGSVHGIKVKVGPFPKPSEDDEDEDEKMKIHSVSVESSNTELGGKRLSDESVKKDIKDYYENEGLEAL